MSTFLTPPVWYDGNGTLNEMLTGKSSNSTNVVIGSSAKTEDLVTDSIVIYGSATGDLVAPTGSAIVIGKAASASATGAITIGGKSSATANKAIAIGDHTGTTETEVGARATAAGAIAIGGESSATAVRAIAIGDGASATSPHTIQLGSETATYGLQVGNGIGTSKIGALSFNSVTPTSITSSGLYWCTADKTLTVSGKQQTQCYNAFLWIKAINSSTASATDGAVTFTYGDQAGSSDWAIRVSGDDVKNLKCYKVFA